MIKSQLIEICDEDKQCQDDVNDQYYPCLKNTDFLKYMNSVKSKEDEYLQSTMNQLSACILDGDDQPYFDFDGLITENNL